MDTKSPLRTGLWSQLANDVYSVKLWFLAVDTQIFLCQQTHEASFSENDKNTFCIVVLESDFGSTEHIAFFQLYIGVSLE